MSARLANGFGFIVCVVLLGYAYYLQYHDGLEPCPLCIFQRVTFFALAVVFLIATLHDARRVGTRIYATLIGLTSLTGIGLAARHIYIQSLPAGSVPSCGASLDFLLQAFPLMHVIRKVLTGSGECSKVDWTLLGLSMPYWTLVAFAALGIWGVVMNVRRARA